jgi:hypothetical protein
MLEARPIRRMGNAALMPLREKALFPGCLLILQGKGIDIHATGLDPATAEWPLVGAGSDARERAILRARKVGSPAAPLLATR